MPPLQERAILLCNQMALVILALSLVLYVGMLLILEGYVEVNSEPGVGTTFSVWLPQLKEVVADEKAKASST